MDLTDEDLDDLREDSDPSGSCLVCLNPCKSWSNDLFLYTCHCIYRIHPECYKLWRLRTATDRVCLICREEFDTFGYVQEEPAVPRPRPVLYTTQEHRHSISCREKIYMMISILCVIAYSISFLHSIKPSWQ